MEASLKWAFNLISEGVERMNPRADSIDVWEDGTKQTCRLIDA